MCPGALVSKKLRYIFRIHSNRIESNINFQLFDRFESNSCLPIRTESNIESNWVFPIEYRIEFGRVNSVFGRIELRQGPIRFETTSVLNANATTLSGGPLFLCTLQDRGVVAAKDYLLTISNVFGRYNATTSPCYIISKFRAEHEHQPQGLRNTYSFYPSVLISDKRVQWAHTVATRCDFRASSSAILRV